MSRGATLPEGRGSTRERVAAALRAEILDGVLAPGVSLRTEAVTERLGVSNSPLREAFVQLEAEGLVEVTPNRGVVVAPLTRSGAADLIRIGTLLWDAGIRWIVPTLEPATVDTLRKIDVDFGLGLRSGDLAGAVLDAERFDRALLESCWSTELVRSIDAVQPRLQRLGRLVASYSLMDRRRALHAAVLRSAGSTDLDPVAAAMREVWSTLASAVQDNPRVAP
jgi:DNA-binding GntR family transcriptional regulator